MFDNLKRHLLSDGGSVYIESWATVEAPKYQSSLFNGGDKFVKIIVILVWNDSLLEVF